MKGNNDIDLDDLFKQSNNNPLLTNQIEQSQEIEQNPSPHKRDQWNNDLEYFMSVLGYAVGYGSLWRFPYIMYKNGGGVFLIPYTFFVIIIAIPVFILETGLGQIYQKSLPIIFEQKIHKKWKGFGIWAIMVATTMATYYNYIQAISIRYFLCSFTSPLPWSLGEVQVLGYENANAFLLTNILNVSDSINTYGSLNTPLLLCYFSSMIAVFFTIFKGPTYSGRIALVTASVPYLLLIIMFINGCTLDGSSAGLYYLFMPDLSLLKTTTIWVDALVQVLFQFSCGMGVLVSFGSYRNKSKSLKKAAYGLIIGTFICGILGGIIVFQYLGHMSHLSGVAINALPLQGPQLAFVAYPSALAMIPFPRFFSLLFFFMMILLGIDTQMGLCECICGYLEDQFGNTLILSLLFPSLQSTLPLWLTNKSNQINKACMLIIISLFGLLYCSGAGIYLLEHIDNFNATIGITGQLLSEVYLVVYHSNFYNEYKLDVLAHTNEEVPRMVDNSLKYCITPLLTVFLAFGIHKLFIYSLTVSLQVFLLLWLLQLIPIYVALKTYSNNKDLIQIYTQSENELIDVKYYKPKSNIHRANTPYY